MLKVVPPIGYPTLFSPISVGPRITLMNRFVMSPMALNFECDDDKLWSKRYFEQLRDFYAPRAEHGAGLIVIGGVAPSRIGTWRTGGPYLSNKDVAKEFNFVTEGIHEYGGKVLLQAFHAGRGSMKKLYASSTRTPSRVHPFPNKPFPVPGFAVNYVVSEYERFAYLAELGGFDGIEIPCGEGSLLHNFISSAVNTRGDKFGGSVEGRIEIVKRVLATVKDSLSRPSEFSICVRVCVHDLCRGGSTMQDVLKLVDVISQSGVVDLITTTVGMHDSPVQTLSSHVPQATFTRGAQLVKEHLALSGSTIPVAASHRINTPEVAERLLTEGVCDLIGVARPLLADPEFISKAYEGRADDIIPCIACNHCTNRLYKMQRVACAINPQTTFEKEKVIEPAPFAKTVAVIGAGAAGITCALTLWQRGHTVALFEKAGHIGGQLNLAKMVPGKEGYHDLLAYWTRKLRATSMLVKLNTEFRPEDVTNGQQQFDAVVLTTGSIPRPPVSHRLLGLSESNMVATHEQILTGKVKAGRRVAIIGVGPIAFDVASFLIHDHRVCRTPRAYCEAWGINLDEATVDTLAHRHQPVNNRDIVLFQQFDRHPDLLRSTGWSTKLWLRNHGVTIIKNALYDIISPNGIGFTLTNARKGEGYFHECDTVIYCGGMLQNASLGVFIREHVILGGVERGQYKRDFSIYSGGSCRDAMSFEGNGEQDMLHAVHEGFELGMKI